jgi:hypothetical protein
MVSTRMMLSRRRLLLVVALLCVLMGAFGGLHAAEHHAPGDLCAVAGLGCAIAAALVLLPLVEGPARVGGTARRCLEAADDPSRSGEAVPTSLRLAALCRLRV